MIQSMFENKTFQKCWIYGIVFCFFAIQCQNPASALPRRVFRDLIGEYNIIWDQSGTGNTLVINSVTQISKKSGTFTYDVIGPLDYIVKNKTGRISSNKLIFQEAYMDNHVVYFADVYWNNKRNVVSLQGERLAFDSYLQCDTSTLVAVTDITFNGLITCGITKVELVDNNLIGSASFRKL